MKDIILLNTFDYSEEIIRNQLTSTDIIRYISFRKDIQDPSLEIPLSKNEEVSFTEDNDWVEEINKRKEENWKLIYIRFK